MKSYAKDLNKVNPKSTPQNMKVPGRKDQVKGKAGGAVFKVTPWTQLERFLVFGTEENTYYEKADKLTKQVAKSTTKLLNKSVEDGKAVIDKIVDFSFGGKIPKNNTAIFALALAYSSENQEVKNYAYTKLDKVARTGTDLFLFNEYLGILRPTRGGSGVQRSIGRWYTQKDIDRLAYQLVKYQGREGWTHRDVLRLAKPKPKTDDVSMAFKWAVGKWTKETDKLKSLPDIIKGFEKTKGEEDINKVIKNIKKFRLTREMIPTEMLKEKKVWETLLREALPLTALIRNLGVMSARELFKNPLSENVSLVVQKLGDKEYIKKSRVHPLTILNAMYVYKMGRGVKGSLTWDVNTKILDALDNAFYLAFDNVEPTNKRIMLALDVSGSMGSPIAGTQMTCRDASAALALVTANVEPNYFITGFTSGGNGSWWGSRSNNINDITGLSQLKISPKQRLDDVIKYTNQLSFGGTDCSLPMRYAMKNNIKVDSFVVYTDSETWAGPEQPFQSLKKYRNATGIDAKLIVVAMEPNRFTIADPTDPGMLDVVGFSTSTPNVISTFMKGD